MKDQRIDDQVADEYRINYDRIASMSDNVQSMRGWLITGIAAFVALNDDPNAPYFIMPIVILGAFISEAFLRGAMARIFKRIERIEDHFAGRTKLVPYQARTEGLAEVDQQRGGVVLLACKAALYPDCFPFYCALLGAFMYLINWTA